MDIIDFIASAGSALNGGMKTGAGDDRYVFDEAAGWACVIDGATDVGPVRVFAHGESDAAVFAEIFAQALIAEQPGAASPRDYFARVVERLRDQAGKASRMPLGDAPRASLPTAAATWIRVRQGRLEGVTLGDTLAIVLRPDGSIDVIGEPSKPAEEQARAQKVMSRTPEERKAWLQQVRAIHNTDRGYWVFGVQPEAAGRIIHQSVAAPAGARVLLMTDGFYRLVSPYGRYDDRSLIEAAIARGLGPLMQELRALEADPGDDARIGRFKTSDDATALLTGI
jgi:hypothetical protein